MTQTLILFDLDGTLTDSGEGVTNSAAYALRRFGIVETDPQRLNRFVGPPLKSSFMDFYGFDEARAEQAIAYYREYFTDRGILENRLYPATEDMLRQCRGAGKTLALATSKPTVFARQILENYGLEGYFAHICGSNLDGSHAVKAEIIAQALTDAGVDADDAVMVGDRKYDVLGAKACGVYCIGVSFGYGGREELTEYGADAIVDSMPELAQLICAGQ